MNTTRVLRFSASILIAVACSPSHAQNGVQLDVCISGGHFTERQDRGRPVALVAAALNVPASVFREAFSRVRPAPAGEAPDPHQVTFNKQALLSSLSKFGVTNDRLDQVSNFYRYRPGQGSIWRSQAARILVTISGNKVTNINVVDAGAGYSSVPTLSVPGYPAIKLTCRLAMGTDLRTNGSLMGVSLAPK